MLKRTGLAVVVLMLLAGTLPLMGAADPTREALVEIEDIMLDGEIAPGGEYATGPHFISVVLNNSGTSDFINTTTLYLEISFFENGTVYFNTSEEFTPVIGAGNTVELSFDQVMLEEGTFTIMVNGSFNGEERSHFIVEDVMDVVDLAIESDFFVPDGSYPLGEELLPTCTVTYIGNVEDWNDDVSINLMIELLEDPPVTVYDHNMTIMDSEQAPQDPGHVFSVIFDEGWTPTIPGEYRAVFSVEYDTYNESNNRDSVFFEVDQPPSIEGWVTTSGETPVKNVTVNLKDQFLLGQTFTDDDGYYFFENVTSGTYTLEFIKMWSTSQVIDQVAVVEGETAVVNATVNKLSVGGLRGMVTLPNGLPADGAEVTVNVPGEAPLIDYTDSFGNYSFTTVTAGMVQVLASLEGYVDAVEDDYMVVEQIWNPLDLQLGSIPFTVDFNPPDGEPGFPVDGTVSLEFSRPINMSTVNETTVYLIDLSTSQNVQVSFAFIEGENTVLMSPLTDLKYQTEYRVTVTELVEDINGNFFPQIAYSNFSTTQEITEVELLSFQPGDDQSEVPIDIRIRAVFPEAMDAATINTNTFQVFISGGGGSPIPGNVVYYSNNFTAEFIPLEDLQYNGRYSVSLSGEISPVDLYSIFLGTTWSFETMPLITTGSVVGFVYDEDGEPFSPDQVTVTLERVDGTIIELGVNLDGKFERGDLAEGVWTVTVEAPDHEDYTQDFIVTPGQETSIGEITMEGEDEDGPSIDLGTVILIVLIIVILLILAYVFLGRRERPVEAEEEPARGRGRPPMSYARERPADLGRYEEYAEGEFMCPVCGSVVESDEPYCPNCQSEFEEDLFECPECGSMVPAEAPECPECGAKFEEELTEEEEEELYSEEEEVDITEDYEVDELDEDEFPLREE